MKKRRYELQNALEGICAELVELRQKFVTQSTQYSDLKQQIDQIASAISNQQGFLNERVVDNSNTNKRLISLATFGAQEIFQYVELLREIRQTEKYVNVFLSQNPTISIIIPTHSNPRALWERTLPSIAAQTHENLEVLVIVDGNHPEILGKTKDAAASFGDTRISVHLAPPTPTEFPEISDWTPEQRQQFDWFRSGNGPFNHGLDIASGDWIAPFSHDDAMHHDGYERVLSKAIEMKWEYCYAPLIRLSPTDASIIHSYPPKSHNFGVQGSLLHSSLKMFRYDYRDALVGLPNDYGMVRRMMLCGVRMGTISEAASDYYPSALWA